MSDKPVMVRSGTPCRDVVGAMANAPCVIVNDATGRPVGLVSEQDVVRRMTFQALPETPVDEVMTKPVLTIPASESLYHAVGRMRRHDLRHLPVVSDDGGVVGMLHRNDVLTAASAQMDWITHDDTLKGMADTKAAQFELAEDLLADNVPATDIQALLTHINNDIHRRILVSCIRDLEMEGWGPPPVEFVAIVMGSGGRGENTLFPDQDNGFILEDYPDDTHNRVDGYFRELAERMVTRLASVGIPLCKGNCMAINPLWRKTKSQWYDQVSAWGRTRNRVAAAFSDIFFDFQPIWGHKRELANGLRAHVTAMAKANPHFLHGMYESVIGRQATHGLFGRFIVEREKGVGKGKINLKHNGLLPLIQSVRLLSLREGLDVTPTIGRIDALHSQGILNDAERERLKEAFTHIVTLLLREQIANHKAGRDAGIYVAPNSLPPRERAALRESLIAIEQLRRRVAEEFTVSGL